ncbi:oxidoreductase [Asanoa ishikariensis]|uniref:Methane oxygenase PmoA n=1 Tax=Asanoa ishikariensis TaxID=137265 RepID=A0A1H3RWP6_9ACTN|nr:PmoA family protein [Asanoa ishikariensis]GIF66774.1 oxidoreductase [Asanoa ishikariensis]SDZ29715.1 Methane oxygenase PmoA [Asanoa ishikariensis]
MTELTVDGVAVASYVVRPGVDLIQGPRPYLHPVRTLGGTAVTDFAPDDHIWHLGVSVAMQDVGGANLWGGRTYVRDRGYTWLDDHGEIVHTGWLPTDNGVRNSMKWRDQGGSVPPTGGEVPAGQSLGNTMEWRDKDGAVLLTEKRRLSAKKAPHGWELAIDFTLSAARPVSLGSPATNGRPDGAGYGGFFWRAAPGETHTFTEDADSEEQVNGSAAPWLALTGPGPYTLVFRGLDGDDRWFVRTGIYPGVCAALAFDHPLLVTPEAPLSRRITVLVADGALTREQVASGP